MLSVGILAYEAYSTAANVTVLSCVEARMSVLSVIKHRQFAVCRLPNPSFWWTLQMLDCYIESIL